jgi:hypothetical protein
MTTTTQTSAPHSGHHDKPLTSLASTATDLLIIAQNVGLPMPRSLWVYQRGQDAALQFPQDSGSLPAVTEWAQHFGAALTCDPFTADDGGDEFTHCKAVFTHDGLHVEVYAFIPAGQTSST